jgi:hypothetical protein
MFKENDKGLDDALACAIKGDPTGKEILLSLNQNDPRVRFNLGWYNIREGELYKGHMNLEYGRMLNVFGGAKKGIPPRYDGSTLKNKTLVFHGEGGFGDEIINIRFVKNFHELGAKVIVGCSKELFPLFDRLPYIHALIDREVCTRSHHDYWVPAMSAIMDLKIEYSALSGDPYLNIFNKRWVPKNSSNFKIGLRWAGNPQFEHQQHRKFPIEKMMELTNIKGATYYSLQRDNDLLDNTPCIDMRYEMKSWKDTAEIIASMDLVISSCTSIAHLSAAMGKETWVISPILPYYIWALPINTSPWYKDVKLYRQTEYGNWDEPFDQIKKDLSDKLSTLCTSGI